MVVDAATTKPSDALVQMVPAWGMGPASAQAQKAAANSRTSESFIASDGERTAGLKTGCEAA